MYNTCDLFYCINLYIYSLKWWWWWVLSLCHACVCYKIHSCNNVSHLKTDLLLSRCTVVPHSRIAGVHYFCHYIVQLRPKIRSDKEVSTTKPLLLVCKTSHAPMLSFAYEWGRARFRESTCTNNSWALLSFLNESLQPKWSVTPSTAFKPSLSWHGPFLADADSDQHINQTRLKLHSHIIKAADGYGIQHLPGRIGFKWSHGENEPNQKRS